MARVNRTVSNILLFWRVRKTVIEDYNRTFAEGFTSDTKKEIEAYTYLSKLPFNTHK